MNRQHAGFTLIEISIVLVIIGLLLGGCTQRPGAD
ncbi:type II secretion system protein [Candidatus Venteria ishoeyi]